MSTLTKEWLQLRIAELEAERDATPGAVNEDAAKALAAMKLALASIEAEPAQEWTNEQCLEFLSIAFRHAEIKGDLELDDIRLGVKMANGSRAAMLQGVENAESTTTMQTAPVLDSSPKIAESTSGNSPVISDCSCHTCRPVTISDMRFVVCPECGNKRCPHANDHRHACTGSNEPGQEGSAYPAAPQQEVK
ncbi:hypothetical protein ACLIJ0_00925 [Enterobacter hormaechei]|uniref:hypothetical protein n=1 Tax=Enterobacter hormaechei TaxID=158836 RepID=UPI003A91DA3B